MEEETKKFLNTIKETNSLNEASQNFNQELAQLDENLSKEISLADIDMFSEEYQLKI